MVFLDPSEDGAIPEAAGDLFLQGVWINPGKFQKILIEGTVVGVLPIFSGQGGPTLIQHTGQNDIATEPNPGAAGRAFG